MAHAGGYHYRNLAEVLKTLEKHLLSAKVEAGTLIDLNPASILEPFTRARIPHRARPLASPQIRGR